MAKPIYMTSADVENICAELRHTLTGLKCYGGIDIKRSFKSDDRFAMLYFTPIAWIKMTALVSRFETEVQWHGKVRRISEDEFEVYDILVPPHEVSGATVTSEYKPYIEWMDGLDDDTFNALRFHGHSHVNMAVAPSSVDSKYRLDLITQLPKPTGDDDVFYVFLIINKKHEWSAEIYDLTYNALYSTDDIYVECCLDDKDDVDSFIAGAKKVAIARTTYAYNGSTYYGRQHPSATNAPKSTTTPTQPKVDKTKHKPKKNGDGKFFGYDSLDEYYREVFGEGWDEVVTSSSEVTEIPDDNFNDDDDNPNSPFYVKEY